jgi:hypothetical protein
MTDAGAEAAPRRGRARWVPGLIALAALLTIGFVVGAGGDLSHPPPKNLSGTDVSAQLAIAIQAERSLRFPPALTCPPSEPIRAGFRFRCHFGDGRPIDVVETDGRGHLKWSLPSG